MRINHTEALQTECHTVLKLILTSDESLRKADEQFKFSYFDKIGTDVITHCCAILEESVVITWAV